MAAALDGLARRDEAIERLRALRKSGPVRAQSREPRPMRRVLQHQLVNTGAVLSCSAPLRASRVESMLRGQRQRQ